jgi:NAD(P)-dependent dehydrogenase (short-subunit alcohol dehydrogenase family)
MRRMLAHRHVAELGQHQPLGLSTLADQNVRDMMKANVPLGRMGTSDDLARAAVFLASEDSSYITGIELFVDGGVAQF